MSNNNKKKATSPKEELPTKIESKQELNAVVEQAVKIVIQKYSGPLPLPDMFKKYDQVVPGAAERILKMAENQSNHRIRMEGKVIDSDIKNRKIGQVFAFIICVLALIIGGFLIYSDKNASGLSVILTSLAGIIGIFIYGTYKKSQERIQKERDAKK